MASLLIDTSRTFLEHGRADIVVAVWVLRATCPGSFKASVQATAGSLVQISMIPITIIVQGQNL